MIKRIINTLVFLIGVGLLWYFFIKPQDYQVRVEVNTSPGIVNQHLKTWGSNLKNIKPKPSTKITQLIQEMTFADSVHIYQWNIKGLTDSTSLLKVDILDSVNTFKNKLFLPFLDTDIEKRSRKTITQFVHSLNKHLKNFKVTIKGSETTRSAYCICVPHKTTQRSKAFKMMESYPFLNSIVSTNNITSDGVPLIEVTKWNKENDSIYFNFCYPIIKTDSLPAIKGVEYKYLDKKDALKAIYNGNYITSDRAWYQLLNYAKSNNITVDAKPLEFFYNNPNMGDNELRWKAEIYMPITPVK